MRSSTPSPAASACRSTTTCWSTSRASRPSSTPSGGITVNINEPVAINGDTDAGIPPTGYLQPGPDQHLDGFDALWFARGRYGSDDYARMDRQRCAVDALIEAADPLTLLTKYIDLAAASKDILTTDVPRSLGSRSSSCCSKVKDAKIRSVVFRASEKFFSGDPDYDYVQETVRQGARTRRRRRPSARPRSPRRWRTPSTPAPTNQTTRASKPPSDHRRGRAEGVAATRGGSSVG